MDKITLWGAVLFCFLCAAAVMKDFIVLRKEAKKNRAADADKEKLRSTEDAKFVEGMGKRLIGEMDGKEEKSPE